MEPIEHVYRERAYWHHRSCVWFELCPVVKTTDKSLIAKSETYSTIGYPGGEFTLNKQKLLGKGCVYHSRHGEWFWLEKPRQGDLFPTQQLLDFGTALHSEAEAMGWDVANPLYLLQPWQKDCWFLAHALKRNLRSVVDQWKFGGQSAIDSLYQEVRDGRVRLDCKDGLQG